MIKGTLLLFAVPVVSLFSFSSCEREEDEVYIEPYVVTGVGDLYWKKNFLGPSEASLPLKIDYLNSRQEYLTMSVEGVPTGVSYSLTPAGGYVPFSTILRFVDSNAAPGSYLLKLKTTGTYTPPKVYDIRLVIDPTITIASAMTGNYSSSTPLCFSPISSIPHRVYRNTTHSDTVFIESFYNTFTNLGLLVHPSNGSFVIYEQDIQDSGVNYKISGSGYITLTNLINVVSIHLNIILFDPLTNFTGTCDLTLSR